VTDSILTKIKALLTKAASTNNQHEAAAFAAKANELMEKYQIDVDSIRNTDDPVGRDKIYQTVNAAAGWRRQLAGATARYYGCRVVHTVDPHKRNGFGTEVEMFGRESARVTALAMLPYFITTVGNLCVQMSKETGWTRAKCANQIGMELANRLRTLAPAMERGNEAVTGKNALIRLDEVNAMVEAAYPHLRKARAPKFTTSSRAAELANSVGLSGQVGSRSAMRIGAR
jgi:hypothetical protein